MPATKMAESVEARSPAYRQRPPGKVFNEEGEMATLINHGFYGNVVPYAFQTPSAATNGWGGFYVCNPHRNQRPRAATITNCPFCPGGNHFKSREFLQRFSFHGKAYLYTENAFPILPGHRLILPVDHQTAMLPADFQLACTFNHTGASVPETSRYVDQGFEHGPCAAYMNTAGAGQTLEHAHWQVMPAASVPLPDVTATTAILTTQDGKCQLRRVSGIGFYAMELHACDTVSAADWLSRLQTFFADSEIPINLLIYDDRGGMDPSQRILIVPRRRVFCSDAKAYIGGFELLTGILMPVEVPAQPITVEQRDKAFRSVTLSAEASAVLEERLQPLGCR